MRSNCYRCLVEYGEEPDSQCNHLKCKGDRNYRCGAGWTNTVYRAYGKTDRHVDSYMFHNYRPQKKFAKVMFLQVSVCPRGVCLSACWDNRPPREQTPPRSRPPGSSPPPEQTPTSAQCMLGDTANKRAVRILLECILVSHCIIVHINVLTFYRKVSWMFPNK